MNTLAGKTAIITGAAQGIGRATAMHLAGDGARVTLVDRVADACNEVCDDITATGGSALAIEADLETKAGVDSMVEQALTALNTIDIAIHNVGGTMWTKPFWEYSDDEMQREIQHSLWPTLRCCRAVIPVMMRQKHGVIVNIGSVTTRGIYRVPYAAAKGGVHAITVCMARELAGYNIRVNCVAPGAISANRVIPRKPEPPSAAEQQWHKDVIQQTLDDSFQERLGTAEEVAAAVAFFAGDASSYVTGQVMYVAGGGTGQV